METDYISTLESIHVTPSVLVDDRNFISQYYTLSDDAEWTLTLKNDTYQLEKTSDSLALSIDFRSGKYRHRNQHVGKEPLLAAIKVKKKLPTSVIDTTPGVLKDSFMMAGRGINVIAIERNPLLYTMINHALSLAGDAAENIRYYFGDAGEHMDKYHSNIIYLDPMYPSKKKSAQVKKDMQILHEIIGDDSDAGALLDKALHHANSIKARVVVKRPRYAEPLAGRKPHFSSQTGNTRFDIYL